MENPKITEKKFSTYIKKKSYMSIFTRGTNRIIGKCTQQSWNANKNNILRETINKIASSGKFTLENLTEVEESLSKGADSDVHDNFGRTALYILINILQQNPAQFTPETSAEKLKKFLHDYNIDVNKNIDSLHTPLSYTLSLYGTQNYPSLLLLLKSLINEGADLNKKNSDGNPPLTYALNTQNTETIIELVKAGAQLTGLNNSNDTIFHYLARSMPKYFYENPCIVETIITHARFLDNEIERTKARSLIETFFHTPTLPPQDDAGKDLFYTNLYKQLVDNEYCLNDLTQAKNNIEALLELLCIKNQDDYTAADLLGINLYYQHNQLFANKMPLLNGTQAQNTINILDQLYEKFQKK